eukprot:293729-Amphidinium_carterae.1
MHPWPVSSSEPANATKAPSVHHMSTHWHEFDGFHFDSCSNLASEVQVWVLGILMPWHSVVIPAKKVCVALVRDDQDQSESCTALVRLCTS